VKRWSQKLALPLMLVSGACHPRVAQIGPPSMAKEGVSVEVISLDCRTLADPEGTYSSLELQVLLAVANNGPADVQFHPDRLSVTTAAGRALWPQSPPGLAVPRNERRQTLAQFSASGALACSEEMSLHLGDSVAFGTSVPVPSIRFTPPH
jgi:hypothetical protein